MSAWLIIACGVAGIALAFRIPTDYLPQSPIGEQMPKGWDPHPRIVVQPDPFASEEA